MNRGDPPTTERPGRMAQRLPDPYDRNGATLGLIQERVTVVQPSLVRALGLTKAVVLQQLHWHLNDARQGIEHDGHDWYPVTEQALAAEIGLTRDVVHRAIAALEGDGFVLSRQPEGMASRRKRYRIDHEALTDRLSDSAHCAIPHNPIARQRTIPLRDSAQSPSIQIPSSRPLESAAASQPPPRAEVVRARQPRDDLFDALVAAFGPAETRSTQAFYAKVAGELLDAHATPDDVAARADEMRRRDWADAGPAALAKHWSELGQRRRRKVGALGATLTLIERERNGTG